MESYALLLSLFIVVTFGTIEQNRQNCEFRLQNCWSNNFTLLTITKNIKTSISKKSSFFYGMQHLKQYISKLVLPTCSGFCKNRTDFWLLWFNVFNQVRIWPALKFDSCTRGHFDDMQIAYSSGDCIFVYFLVGEMESILRKITCN